MITILYKLIEYAINLLTWAIILAAVVSTLISFNILDTRNRLVWSVADFLARVTEPVLRPVRRRMPATGNIDFSPLVVLVLLNMVAAPLVRYIYDSIVSQDLSHVLIGN